MNINEITTSYFANAPRNDIKSNPSQPCLGFAPRSQSFAFCTYVHSVQSVRYSDSLCSVRAQIRSLRKGRRKCAFTLVEVLITLGIIGALPASTLPPLIQNYNKQPTVNQLKKAYSTLGQVAQKAFADIGPAGFETGSKLNANDVKDFFDTYWLPYFKGAQVYPERKQPNLNNNTDYYKYLNGDYAGTHIYTIYDGGRILFSTADGITYFVFIIDWINQKYDENGNLMSQDGVYTPNQTVYVDVNGTKPPNTFGKDVFVFVVDFDKGFVRPFKYDSTQTYVDNNCKTYGTSCAAKIISDGWKINY